MEYLNFILLILHSNVLLLQTQAINSVNLFLRSNKDFQTIDYGKLASFTNLSRIFCFNECRKRKSCSIVRIEKKTCTIHSLNSFFNNSKIIKTSTQNVLYQKSLIRNYCNPNPCLNSGTCVNEEDNFVCLCTQGFVGKNCSISINNLNNTCSSNSYWSLKQEKCINCPQNFIRYNQIPFACYNLNSTRNNFTMGKSYCEKLTNGSHLLRPKTITERNHFWSLFGDDNLWVDSFISFLGQLFTWGDGDSIYGFDFDEPDNWNNITMLVENALFLKNSTYRDSRASANNRVICEYSV